MRLVDEAQRGGDVRRGVAGRQPPLRPLQQQQPEICRRRQAEAALEQAGQVEATQAGEIGQVLQRDVIFGRVAQAVADGEDRAVGPAAGGGADVPP